MKKITAFLLTAILLCSMTGCGKESAAEDGLEEVSVVLDWYPNALHTFLYAAEERGYFAQEGLKLKVNFPANTNDGISLPAAGKADVGMYYLQDAILTAVEEDVPIVSIGAVTQKSLDVVISLKESGIASAADLAGKKIGYAGTALSEAKVECMLEKAGVSAADCELIDVGFDLLTAITTGQVDATIGNNVNHEVPQLEEQGFAVNYFSPSDFGVPDYYEVVFLTGQKTLEENPEKLQKFLRAVQKGFAYTQENPEDALQILLEHQNEANFPLSETVEAASLQMLLPMMETAEAPFLSQDTAVWQENADWLYQRGLLSKQTDVSALMVNLLGE